MFFQNATGEERPQKELPVIRQSSCSATLFFFCECFFFLSLKRFCSAKKKSQSFCFNFSGCGFAALLSVRGGEDEYLTLPGMGQSGIPWKTVPGPHHTHRERFLPKIQPKFALCLFESILPYPVFPKEMSLSSFPVDPGRWNLTRFAHRLILIFPGTIFPGSPCPSFSCWCE